MTAPHLSIISLNIERSKHLERVIPFLSREKPDVFCVQEICESDIPLFERVAGELVSFAPIAAVKFPGEEKSSRIGTGIFSRFPATSSFTKYYVGGLDNVPIIGIVSNPSHDIVNHAISYCDIEKDGTIFSIGTTHFVPSFSISQYEIA